MRTLAIRNPCSPATAVGGFARPPGMLRNVASIAARELRDAVRSRWFLLYTLGFAALGLGVSYISAASGGGTGLSGFGRTAAGLTNLVLLIVPLMGLNAGAVTIASDRERGMLSYLSAQPVSRLEIVIGKYLGLAMALFACLCLGLGSSAMVLAFKGEATAYSAFIWLAGLSFMLALGMLSAGILVSVLVRKVSAAIGVAIFLWLTLVFGSDLGLMAGALAMKMSIERLFALSLINPLQVFKMWSLQAVDGSLDVLGPAGLYASEEYGAGLHVVFALCMGAWVALPLLVACIVFSRRSSP